MSTELFDPIKTQSKITDSVIVMFSGGKESVVVLDLCKRYFKNVEACFLYIVPNLSFEEKTMRWYEEKYDIQIRRIPHPQATTYLHYGFFTGFDPFFPVISSNDVSDYLRGETGIKWIAGGERIADSMWRRGFMKKSGSIDYQRGRIYPISEWLKKDVLDYIKFHKLYLGADSRKLGYSWRSLQGDELVKIKYYFPDDYERILHLYPMAEAEVIKEEMKDGKK